MVDMDMVLTVIVTKQVVEMVIMMEEMSEM